jgi:DHA3 family macrolide efflux protein-like MFS transporter
MEPQSNNIPVESAYQQVLKLPSFRALWFGQICSQLAVNTLLFVLALRIYQTTGSNTAVSGLFLAYGIPAVLFGLIAGTAVDQLDKRRVLIICDIIRSLFAFGLLFTSHQVVIVYILMFLNAVITQFYVPSEAPLIPKIVPKHLLVSANSLFTFTYYSSLAIGSVFAGPVLRFAGPQGVFFLIAFLFLTASALSSRIPSQSIGTIGFRFLLRHDFGYLLSRIYSSLVEGIRYVTQSKPLFDAIMLLTGTQIIMALLGTLGPGFADRVLRIDVRDASLLVVGPTVLGILAGVLWVGTKGYKFKQTRLIQVGVSAAGIILILIAVTIRLLRMDQLAWVYTANIALPFAMFLFFLLGVANSLLDVPANSILQDKAQGSLRGRVYGMLTAFVGGVGILPVIISGILADTVGIGKVILILGLGIVLFSLYRVRYNKDSQ